MSGLYSDLPATGDGSGDGTKGSWIRPKLMARPQARAKAKSAVKRPPAFNPLSGHASQSPLVSAAGAPQLPTKQTVKSMEQRLAAASAKLSAKSKKLLAGAAALGGSTSPGSGASASGAASSSSSSEADMFPTIPDEYDPRKPNDYADYCEMRLARKKKELAQRDLERQMRMLEEERKRIKAQDAKQGYSSLRSAVDAARAGGRGRGRALTVPAWMVKQAAAADGKKSPAMAPPPPAFNSPATAPGQFDDAASKGDASAAPDPGFGGASLSKAAQMMSRMGYKRGRGLGAKEDGIASALEHKPTGGGMGKLMPPPPSFSGGSAKGVSDRGPPPPAFGTGGRGRGRGVGGGGGAGLGRGMGRGMGRGAISGMAPPPPSAPTAKRRKAGVKNPSPIVLLRNMVDPGEVDDALEGEIRGECSKFGGVVKVMIFEVKNYAASGCPKEGAVRIFVEFTSLAGAMKAVQDLDGRYFAKRRISAVFFPKPRFTALDLQPKPTEPPLHL